MATQSLYRRYRPRRFGEVKGQEHVVRALRNAVINHREGQAYLFSGPRGTGKTTSARILAKVLNCERPVDGEPCCECESCLAVERGTSYDVHELDAASNNGVDSMRDLIEKASLGTPGRHKVYILDEVHMLSKAAEAALLKTLEEPPPHVVFVLATTDPQKVSDTIRSRTQHLQFHLLPMDVMEDHIRWLAGDAGIQLSDDALQSVLRQGGGSARDTVSALELVAAGGGEALEITPLDEFVEAFIEHDPGRALAVVAHAVQQGRDPRTLTEDIVRHLRDCFLSLMAPELVQLPAQRAGEVTDLATRLGAAAIVRSMERLGEMLVEMRHAPDPRLLLEVALVQLTHHAATADVGVLVERIERLEQQVAAGAAAPAPRPVAIDPATGRAALGSRARATAPSAPPASSQPSSRAPTQAPAAQAPTSEPAQRASAPAAAPPPARSAEAPVAAPAPGAGASPAAAGAAVEQWSQVLAGMKSLPRAVVSATKLMGARDGVVVLAAPNEMHRSKCSQYIADVEAAIVKVVGSAAKVSIIVDGAADDGGMPTPPDRTGPIQRAAAPVEEPPFEEPEAIDLDELVDVPPESVQTPTDRLLDAFPGSQLIEE
ncbi:MAG: DNA polymerase III subunit gamma/tau [Acidobacteria bacterium]|nr:DNA polymerase III subunit gamma/tau [Acidobacteriota bacterium]